MGKAWKNERGMTLLELMAAVVILVLVAIPLTSIGTTVYRWHKEDEQKTRAVLLAEQKISELKQEFEMNPLTQSEAPEENVAPIEPGNLQMKVTLERNLLEPEEKEFSDLKLIDVTVEVLGPDLENPSEPEPKTLTSLSTTIRKKAPAGGKQP